jgi:thiosulfate dehydrogenase
LIVAFYFSFPTLVKVLTPAQSQARLDPHHLSVDPGHSRYYELNVGGEKIHFNLVDPGTAPPEIREMVQQGFKIISQTSDYAKEYNGSKLNCINCHFCGGNTFDGKNGSISLLGAPYWFPEYSQRDGKMMTLVDRINNCFIRSLNGKIPPADGPIVQSIVAYLEWISSEVKNLPEYPWRGLKALRSDHAADPEKGKTIYEQKCAICHQKEGEGFCDFGCTVKIPPLWGEHSYNDGAGMAVAKKLASFVYYNMPYQQPSLSEDEAIDVTSYVLKQPRPHFIKPTDKTNDK